MLSKIFKNDPQFSEEYLSSLQEVSELDLNDKITGKDISPAQLKQVAEILKTNTSIKELTLDCLDIADNNAAKKLAKGLEENHTLKTLTLKNGNISDESMKALAALLTKNHTITSLVLKYVSISTSGIMALAHALATNTSLAKLGISLHSSLIIKRPNSSFSDEGIRAVMKALVSNPNTQLRTLSLKHGILDNGYKDICPSEKTVNEIARVFKTNTSLTHIDLPIKSFSKNEHYTILEEALSHNKNILSAFREIQILNSSNQWNNIQSICDRNSKEALELYLNCEKILPTSFSKIPNKMFSKIAERKAALMYTMGKWSEHQTADNQNIDNEKSRQLKTLITHSDTIPKSLEGYNVNPPYQLGITATYPVSKNEQTTELTLPDLPLELQKHIFSYIPLGSLKRSTNTIPPESLDSPSKEIVPATATAPCHPEIVPAAAASQPIPTPSRFSLLGSQIKTFFVNLFQCIFAPFITKNTPSPAAQPVATPDQPAASFNTAPQTQPPLSRDSRPIVGPHSQNLQTATTQQTGRAY